MKNLPEKIYLNLNMTPQEIVETKDKDFHEATKTWEITWSEECLSEHDPEYVHKDVFIEKANKWLSLNMKMIMNVLDVEYDTHDTDIKDFIEDFKKYVEEQL